MISIRRFGSNKMVHLHIFRRFWELLKCGIQYNRWIDGRQRTVQWPAKSPDPTPLDFLWDYLKSKVYTTKPQDLDDLRQRVVDACAAIKPEMIRSSIEKFYIRLALCQEVMEEHF